jgi:hypothetical protein
LTGDYGTTRSGLPITDELVDELVAKAEAGYDVDELLAGRQRGEHPADVDGDPQGAARNCLDIT